VVFEKIFSHPQNSTATPNRKRARTFSKMNDITGKNTHRLKTYGVVAISVENERVV